MKKNLGMLVVLPCWGARVVSLALFAITAACVFSVSSAKAAVDIAYWTFPNSSTSLTANGTAAHVTASIAVTTGTHSFGANNSGTTISFPAAAGTAVKSSYLNIADGSVAPVFTITISGTGISGFTGYSLTYAGESAGNSTRTITWAYQLNGTGAFTAFSPAQTDSLASGGFVAQSDTFNVAAFATATSITFRGTFGGSTSSGANFDNFDLQAVPELANYAMSVFGLVFVAGTAGFTLRRKLAAAKTA